MKLFDMNKLKNLLKERLCIVYIVIYFSTVLFVAYRVLTRFSTDVFLYKFLGSLSIMLAIVGVIIMMISGTKLLNKLPSDKKKMAELYERVKREEELTGREELSYASDKTMRTTLKCSLIPLSLGLIFFILFKVIF